jgi:hypothetical protein
MGSTRSSAGICADTLIADTRQQAVKNKNFFISGFIRKIIGRRYVPPINRVSNLK